MDKRLINISLAILSLTFLLLITSACGPSQTEVDATATIVASNIFATLTAQAPTVNSTYTPNPTDTDTPTSTSTPTEVSYVDPKSYLPIESEMPRNFSLVTNNIISSSGILQNNKDVKAYTLAYENWNNTISGEPLYVLYAGFVIPNISLAQKTYEFWCNSENPDELFQSALGAGSSIKFNELVDLNSKVKNTEQSVILARTVDNWMYDNYKNFAKTYFACYRERNFVGITYIFVYRPEIEYHTNQVEYFASLSIDKLITNK